jgi:hypothetical protein
MQSRWQRAAAEQANAQRLRRKDGNPLPSLLLRGRVSVAAGVSCHASFAIGVPISSF